MIPVELTERFPQLCVCPADDATEAYRAAALRGIAPEGATLSHFKGSPDDFLKPYDTPAGDVDVLFLAIRDDFECALRCLCYRCRPEPIPTTVGAMCLDGLADWSKIAAERARVISRGESWADAFAEFRKDPRNYRCMLVVVSEGPYSAVDASRTPFGETEWILVSRQIRIYHELTHVVCRRLMPDDKPPVYDELIADWCGLVHATGAFDPGLAATFIGVSDEGYTGGRLETYLKDGTRDLDEVARECHATLLKMQELTRGATPEDAFDLALDLKRRHLLDY